MYDENSFSALNKLVDYANDQTIQKQMTQSMNESIANMRIPGAGNPMPHTKAQTELPKGENRNEN
ncbi:MAG: hypothetical protein Ta2G_17690 [Termitinemataceae bacterium]|nr:MAG: hypothetical protein Ta2G_17690 [Termitinemataceae bacterium]